MTMVDVALYASLSVASMSFMICWSDVGVRWEVSASVRTGDAHDRVERQIWRVLTRLSREWGKEFGRARVFRGYRA